MTRFRTDDRVLIPDSFVKGPGDKAVEKDRDPLVRDVVQGTEGGYVVNHVHGGDRLRIACVPTPVVQPDIREPDSAQSKMNYSKMPWQFRVDDGVQ